MFVRLNLIYKCEIISKTRLRFAILLVFCKCVLGKVKIIIYHLSHVEGLSFFFFFGENPFKFVPFFLLLRSIKHVYPGLL